MKIMNKRRLIKTSYSWSQLLEYWTETDDWGLKWLTSNQSQELGRMDWSKAARTLDLCQEQEPSETFYFQAYVIQELLS